jgi:very-short-patch-repair endonuclease
MGDKRTPDAEIAQVAGRQHGAISSTQLQTAGLSRNAVAKRCKAGRLHRLHRGVYAVGHIAPSNERRWIAAVLALGDSAVLSHRSAAELWGLLPVREGPVDVSVPGRNGRRRRQGIRIHRPGMLELPELNQQRGIPVTSPARTLADLRSCIAAHDLRRAIRQADFLGLPTGPDVEVDRTRSELERRFLRLCHRHHLPTPAVNVRIGAMTVDFCWTRQRFIVETDGYRSHGGREAFESDRARDLRLRTLGYEVLRLSHRQVFDEGERVANTLRALVGAP